jgi:hypothetical protein
MRELLILAIHLLVTFAKLLRPGGVRAVATESLLLKHQLLISNRSRQRAPNLTTLDRCVLGLTTRFIPGLIYSIWRLTTRQKVCPSCGNAGMIPIATPGSQQLAERFAARPAHAQATLSSSTLPDSAGVTTYRVVLDGNTLLSFAPDEVRQRLATLINRSEEIAGKLLSGCASTVKAGVDHATGLHYVGTLKKIGVSCHLGRDDFERANRYEILLPVILPQTKPSQVAARVGMWVADCNATRNRL